MQALVKHLRAASADIILYFDVASEIGKVGSSREGIRCKALAVGETLQTLAASGCSEALKRLIATRPGINLQDGLGQVREIGELAVRKLLADPAFLEFLVREVFEPLFKLHNGCVRQVELIVCSSLAGGTGGPVGPVVAKALSELFLSKTSAVVQLVLVRVGSLSYLGLGPRVHVNGGAGLCQDLDFVLSPEHHAKESRHLFLLELPMVDDRQCERDAAVVQFMQAMRSSAVRNILAVPRPNDGVGSPLGTVCIVQVGWWNALENASVTAEAAARYVPHLTRVLGVGPRPDVVGDVQVQLEPAKVKPSRSVEELVEILRRSNGVQPPEFLQTCSQLHGNFGPGTVLVRLRDKRENLTEDLRLLFSEPCRSSGEFIERSALMRAIELSLCHELEKRTARLDNLRRALDREQRELARVIQGMFPRSVMQRLVTWVGNPRTRLAAFKTAVTQCQNIGCQVAVVEAEKQALDCARAELSAELAAETGRLKKVIDMLSSKLPKPGTEPVSETIEMEDLDAVLPALLDLAATGALESESLERQLTSAVRAVTLPGLAKIFGSSEARVASVAAQIVGGEPPEVAPPWGGEERLVSPKQTITVLPPVDRGLLDKLGSVVQQANPAIALVAADTAEAGVNAVRLEFFKPNHLRDLFTPHISQDVREACKQPELNFTNGFRAEQFLDRLEQLEGLEEEVAQFRKAWAGNGEV
jgi:hypothetical protein